MFYPADLQPDGDGWMVTFPDIPEANTSGKTQEEALEMAADALATAMEFYFEDRRPVPMPSKAAKGQPLVELPASVAAKVLLLNEMIKQEVRPIDLARRMGKTPQEVTRLVDLKHATKIDSINAALQALGRSLDLRLVKRVANEQ
jgi:antitoxin HicB